MTASPIAILTLALSAPLAAQWLNYPTPGIPRTPTGKPNLAAPTPRTADGKPDLSGVWTRISPKYARDIAADLKPGEVQPWAEALLQQRKEDFQRDYMNAICVPLGPGYNTAAQSTGVEMMKIVQTPAIIVILNPDLTYRQIYLDGRKLESNPNPSWMGYSVGHWEGDTLVVETNGYNDKTWLDHDGHPHTEALRTTERYRRTNFGNLEMEETLSDPGAYAKSWTVKVRAELAADMEMLEWVCNESSGDSGREHWVGKASDFKKTEVRVAPEILAKYAGVYEELDLWGPGPHPRVIEITTSGGTLFAELKGRGKTELIAQSETRFMNFFGLGIDFVKNGDDPPAQLLEMHVSGNYRFTRKK